MTKREVNVDLFRVIATVFVVALHVLGQGGVLRSASPYGAVYWTAWFLEICSYCAVNCFALITGYVMVNRAIKAKNIIGLWLQVLFYSLLITTLFFAFYPETRSVKALVYAIFPVVGHQWWYISAYFALFFFIPFLNTAIEHISKKVYKQFLVTVLIGLCVFDCAIPGDAFVFNGGYSAIWLMVVYLFGAYIKKYDLKQRITAPKSLLGFFAVNALTFASKAVIGFATNTIFGQVKYDDIFISYISITILLAAIFLFLFCLNIKIGSVFAKVICLFAPASLGVYLIHVHPLVFGSIVKDAFVLFAYESPAVMALCVVAASVAILVGCTVIELLRIQLFKLAKVNQLCEYAGNRVNTLYLKICRD